MSHNLGFFVDKVDGSLTGKCGSGNPQGLDLPVFLFPIVNVDVNKRVKSTDFKKEAETNKNSFVGGRLTHLLTFPF